MGTILPLDCVITKILNTPAKNQNIDTADSYRQKIHDTMIFLFHKNKYPILFLAVTQQKMLDKNRVTPLKLKADGEYQLFNKVRFNTASLIKPCIPLGYCVSYRRNLY